MVDSEIYAKCIKYGKKNDPKIMMANCLSDDEISENAPPPNEKPLQRRSRNSTKPRTENEES